MQPERPDRRDFLHQATAGTAGLTLAAGAAAAQPAAKGSLAVLGGKPVRTEPFPSWPVVEKNDRDAWAKVRHNEPIANLIHKLQDYRLRFVTVVDDDGKAIGVLGQQAVMEYISEYFPLQVKTQDMEAKVSLEQREGA